MSRETAGLIAGNWKMNGLMADGLALAKAVVDRVAKDGRRRSELLLCPPATMLAEVGRVLAGSPVALGGQDCHAADQGPHTGDVGAAMLANVGCRYVILGHSERRAEHGESDALVAAKAGAAHRAGLIAIVCVGETAAERDAGRAAAVVAARLQGSLPPEAAAGNTVIAYEPLWAIGSGRTPTLDQVRDMHAHIRGRLTAARGEAEGAAIRILYGGSVTPGNAAGLLAVDQVGGALVGGASLSADDFWAIAQSCP